MPGKNYTRWGEIFGTWVANAAYTYHVPILGDISVKAVSVVRRWRLGFRFCFLRAQDNF